MTSRMVKKLPRDLDIFSSSTRTNPLCIQTLARYHPEVIRFFILSSHYRSPLNYSDGHLDEAKAGLTRLYTALRAVDSGAPGAALPEYQQRFEQAMDDDFNSREAVTVLHEIAGELNKLEDKSTVRAADFAATLTHLGGALGLMQLPPAEFLQGRPGAASLSPAEIETLIQERAAAKARKDYAAADRIRADLSEKGVLLEDGAGGATWRLRQ